MSDSDWAASDEVIQHVIMNTRFHGTVLELGSGVSTVKFAEAGLNVISVEHDQAFIKDIPNVRFVYAPIELFDDKYQLPNSIKKRIHEHKGWYNREALWQGIGDVSYDCIFVDGPPREFGRSGFFANLALFERLSVPIIFDDMHRIDDLYIAQRVAQALGRDLRITNHGQTIVGYKANGDPRHEDKKPFGIIRYP